MRQLILLFLLIPTMINAQEHGRVIYKETMKLDIKLDDSEDEQIKTMLPSSRKSYSQVIFNDKQSIFKSYEKMDDTNDDQPLHFTSESGANIKIEMTRPDNRLIRDLETQLVTEKIEFMGKNFLISDEKQDIEWKLTGEQKQILDYTCMKATWEDSTTSVVAWFTPQIAVPTGPSRYGNLPGMILELELNDGERTYQADEVIFETVEEKEFELPKKLKEVSREEFTAIREEKMKEMREMYGGDGRHQKVIIRSQ